MDDSDALRTEIDLSAHIAWHWPLPLHTAAANPVAPSTPKASCMAPECAVRRAVATPFEGRAPCRDHPIEIQKA
eukprot:2205973-Prymnesium_polylepis.2